MDIGPQNVLGKRPPLVDPVVMEIVKRIEQYIDLPDMEFEARLGTLVLPGQQVASRLPLPILSETVLPPSGSCTAQNGRGFKYEFQAGLEKSLFDKIEERMEELHLQKFSNIPNPVFKILNIVNSRTVDEVYKKPIACRVRYDWATYPGSAEPLEFICKESMEKMDVWMGHYSSVDDEGSAEEESHYPYDYRFAINKEKKLDNSLLSQLNRSDCVLRRERVRKSYEMKAWVVDLTAVVEAGSGVTKYEVEAELKLDLLMEQMKRRAAGKPNGVYQIVQDFLIFIRDLASIFGPGQKISVQNDATDLTECDPGEALKKKYVEKISPVFPIVGDYIFRTLDEYMGNTCVKPSSKSVTTYFDKVKSPRWSVSTDMGPTAQPISNEFVSLYELEDLSKMKNLRRFYCPTNPLAFVIVDKRSGLTIVSVVGTRGYFSVSTPAGRCLGTVHVKKQTRGAAPGWEFEWEQYAADADSTGALNVYQGLQLVALIDGPSVSIQRGTDLVMIFLLKTVHDLLLCRSTVK